MGYKIAAFLTKKQTMIVIFVISCCVSFLYEITIDVPELFPYGGVIFKFFAQISYSILASCIFYFITVYLKEKKEKIIFNETIRNREQSIYNSMKRLMHDFMESDDYTDDDIREKCKNTYFFDPPLDTYQSSYCGKIEYYGNLSCYIINEIDKIYGNFAKYIKPEDLHCLEEIRRCQFIRTLEHDYKTGFFRQYNKDCNFSSRTEYVVEFNNLMKKYKRKVVSPYD